jgi:hypothetical protein
LTLIRRGFGYPAEAPLLLCGLLPLDRPLVSILGA